MARTTTVYDLLISCPSDIVEELAIIRDTVDDFNRMYGEINNISINIKHWSKNSYPESNGRPQALLNKQFVNECDMAVGIFWTRFGTPTDNYKSGTEEEIEELIKMGKQVFLYFCDKPINPSQVDHHQYQKVKDFREKYKDNGIFSTYNNSDSFKRQFLNHLTLHFMKLIDSSKSDPTASPRSDLCIKGVDEFDVVTTANMNTYKFKETEFLENLDSEIDTLITKIKSFDLGKVKARPTSEEDMSDEKVVLSSTPSLRTFFNSEYFEFPERDQLIVIEYLNEKNTEHNVSSFFNLGALTRSKNILSSSILGGSPYDYRGTEKEQAKFELLDTLIDKIWFRSELIEYFGNYEEIGLVSLCISNVGSKFDEDIDVRVKMKSDCYIDIKAFKPPGRNVIKFVTENISRIIIPTRIRNVLEFPSQLRPGGLDSLPSTNYPGIPIHTTYDDRIDDFNYELDSVFPFEVFTEREHVTLEFKLDYIKQKTNVYFPAVIPVKSELEFIDYEISSKYQPDIVVGQIELNRKS